MIVAWGLKGSVNEELSHGCWVRNGKLYSRLCTGFDPSTLWWSAKDLKNPQTSNCRLLSPEDQSHRFLCSQGVETGNLGHSLPRLCFQQGSQPTWCLSLRSSRLLPTLHWSFPALLMPALQLALPHCQRAAEGIEAESHSVPKRGAEQGNASRKDTAPFLCLRFVVSGILSGPSDGGVSRPRARADQHCLYGVGCHQPTLSQPEPLPTYFPWFKIQNQPKLLFCFGNYAENNPFF